MSGQCVDVWFRSGGHLLLQLFFMSDVNSFPQQFSRTSPNHGNLCAPIAEIRVSRSKGETVKHAEK